MRQPLRCAEVILPQGKELSSEVLGVVREELNVKDVIFRSSLEGLVTLVARPNYAALGPVFGRRRIPLLKSFEHYLRKNWRNTETGDSRDLG